MELPSVSYSIHSPRGRRQESGAVPREEDVTLYVNGQPLVSMMCFPTLLEELAIGFLYNERLIDSIDDVAVAELCGSRRCIDVWLEHDIDLPQFRTITSGCSGGTTFDDAVHEHSRIESDLRVTSDEALRLMDELSVQASFYQETGGMHSSALAEDGALVCVAEDIGRHNTLDKIAGLCLRKRLACDHCLLLTSGRISSEMVRKAARLGVPIVVSRTSPTSLAIELAHAWNITLIGYARGNSLRVYTGEWRLQQH
ncbi:MAG: formate dehydrogenase accessory sulfurtransferase FdhD [Anaerolineae bacterium]|nr:formate dehydrogenase accessory sulfurtransferase FdhD [Anaerolineae bacterium]